MDEKVPLSPHFTLEQLCTCPSRPDLQFKNRFEAAAHEEPLRNLCATLLEPIRQKFGPTIVTSGYRSETINKAVGGAAESQHVRGEAADFVVPGTSLDVVFDWIRKSELPFGQVIREPRWIHISLGAPYRPQARCRQALRFDGKKYTEA